MEWTSSKMKGKAGHCICAQVFDENGDSLAVIDTRYGEKKASKYAKLIAQSPQMLDALKEVEVFLGHIEPKIGEQAFNTIWQIVTEAIQKAEK